MSTFTRASTSATWRAPLAHASCLAKTKPLIPTGHAGGMWYQMPYPVLLDRGKGTAVWDVDENEYLDLRIGDWVLIHGHANERIRAAVATQMERTSQFGSPSGT